MDCALTALGAGGEGYSESEQLRDLQMRKIKGSEDRAELLQPVMLSIRLDPIDVKHQTGPWT